MRSFKRIPCVLGLFLLSALGACAAPPASSEEVTGATSEALGIYGHMTWNQGAPQQVGMTTSTGFCFLTEVSGGFRGTGEQVYLDINSAGQWTLNGRSSQTGVSATADCVEWRDLGAHFVSASITSWTTSTPQAAGPNTFCYLAGFSGETNGGGEAAIVQPGGGGYNLIVNASSGHGVLAKMACVTMDRDFKMNGQNLYWQNRQSCTPSDCNEYYNVSPSQPGYCLLNQVGGKFRGSGESLTLTHAANSTTSWTLGITSHQGQNTGGVHTTVACNFF